MANLRDNNADLGNQTIEDTLPPIALEAEIVLPDGSTQPIPMGPADDAPVVPTAEELDAKLDALLNNDDKESADAPIILGGADDAQPIILGDTDNAQPIILGDAPDPEGDALDKELESLMNAPDPAPAADAESDELDKALDALMNEPDKTDEQPIITPPPQESATDEQPPMLEPEPEQKPNSSELDAARAMMEQARLMMEQAQSQMQAPVQPPTAPKQTEADEAREMLAKAEFMMEQARQAQLQAQLQAQAYAMPPQHVINTDNSGSAAEAAREMMRQAQMMMQQAQQAQMQAQHAAQQAQLQAQLQAHSVQSAPTMPITDPYAAKEVDRLKNELDSMRELVNKLTFSLAQNQNPAAGATAQQPRYVYDPERDQYRKLETELDRMRREILEKDLRDREKELDRRQKEAENNVKDIRPEMVQMSESREVMPVGSQAPVGGEFIPLANGVFYSTKDKQVYVMTPASNAAASRPTIEAPRPAPVKKKVARPAAKRRSAPRRPGAPSRLRRRPAPREGRPTHR